MKKENNPREEGHTREWQDRARVVLDAKKAAQTEASPNQSPQNEQEKGKESERTRGHQNDDEPVY